MENTRLSDSDIAAPAVEAAHRFVHAIHDDGIDTASVVTPDVGLNSWQFVSSGAEGFRQMQQVMKTAFSDMRSVIHDTIVDGDKVVVRLTEHGVHSGPLMGLEPSGKPVSMNVIHVLRIEDGKVAEHWREADTLGMLNQIKG